MLDLIDRLAGWWLDWRIDRAVAKNPKLQQVGFKRAEFDENGFHLVASFPGVCLLADEAAAMLEANDATNYVQFDMLPRADRHLEPIRITVQWAKGKSPARRVLELESVLDGGVMCNWIDWRERVPCEGEAGFVVFRNMVTGKVWIQNSTTVSGQFWYDNKPLAWMPFPEVPAQYKGNLP